MTDHARKLGNIPRKPLLAVIRSWEIDLSCPAKSESPKSIRRIATRCDKLACNFLASICLVATPPRRLKNRLEK